MTVSLIFLVFMVFFACWCVPPLVRPICVVLVVASFPLPKNIWVCSSFAYVFPPAYCTRLTLLNQTFSLPILGMGLFRGSGEPRNKRRLSAYTKRTLAACSRMEKKCARRFARPSALAEQGPLPARPTPAPSEKQSVPIVDEFRAQCSAKRCTQICGSIKRGPVKRRPSRQCLSAAENGAHER